MQVYVRLSERLGLQDHMMVLTVMLTKICTNLKVFGCAEDVIQDSLTLFSVSSPCARKAPCTPFGLSQSSQLASCRPTLRQSMVLQLNFVVSACLQVFKLHAAQFCRFSLSSSFQAACNNGTAKVAECKVHLTIRLLFTKHLHVSALACFRT